MNFLQSVMKCESFHTLADNRTRQSFRLFCWTRISKGLTLKCQFYRSQKPKSRWISVFWYQTVMPLVWQHLLSRFADTWWHREYTTTLDCSLSYLLWTVSFHMACNPWQRLHLCIVKLTLHILKHVLTFRAFKAFWNTISISSSRKHTVNLHSDYSYSITLQ